MHHWSSSMNVRADSSPLEISSRALRRWRCRGARPPQAADSIHASYVARPPLHGVPFLSSVVPAAGLRGQQSSLRTTLPAAPLRMASRKVHAVRDLVERDSCGSGSGCDAARPLCPERRPRRGTRASDQQRTPGMAGTLRDLYSGRGAGATPPGPPRRRRRRRDRRRLERHPETGVLGVDRHRLKEARKNHHGGEERPMLGLWGLALLSGGVK